MLNKPYAEWTEEEKDALVLEKKEEISNALKDSLKENGISIRKLASSLEMQHPQVLRVTSGENYTINNMVKILDAVGLKIEIVDL